MEKIKPLFIGVTGGTASGKTSLCKYLLNNLYFNLFFYQSLDSFSQEYLSVLASIVLSFSWIPSIEVYRKCY
jgi:uridine kinase